MTGEIRFTTVYLATLTDQELAQLERWRQSSGDARVDRLFVQEIQAEVERRKLAQADSGMRAVWGTA